VTRWAGSLQLALALGAGLATGLAHFPDPVSIAIATVSAAWLSRQWSHAFLAVAIVLAIAWGAALRRGGAQSCANLLPLGEHTLQLRLVDPAHGTARAVPLGIACDGVVRTRWPSSHRVAAGVTATVVARWLPRSGFLGRPQGTLLVRRVLNQDGQPGLLARSRTAVSEATSRWFGARAGLVNALVSGQTGGIAPEIRDRFAAAGLIHVLSISGFHMGLIAFWLVLSLRLATVPPRHAEIIAAGVVLGYTAWLGWPPPATRAAALFAVTVLTRRRQRAARPDALLGASALVVLAIDPWSIVDLGAWLSFAAMAGLLWATQWYRRVAVPRPILEAVAGSVGATLATAPIAALTIGRVAAIGPVVNLIGLPLAALVVPAIAMTLIASWLAPPVAAAFAASSTVMLSLLDRVAAIGATLPGAAGPANPGWSAALPWCALLLLALHATRGGASPREALRRAAWGMTAIIWWPLLGAPLARRGDDGRLSLHFLDVGQGDAALLRTPGGHWIAIDAGPADERFDAGARVVTPFLLRHGATQLSLMVASHAHRDHVGGAASVASAFPVGAVIEPGEPFHDPWYLRWLETLGINQVRWITARPRIRWQLDGVRFQLLHPDTMWQGRGLDLNEDSVVLLVEYGEFRALFTGDAGFPAESVWAGRVGRLDLLKVGHHGSAGSTGDRLLAAARPVVAVISSGRNRYGHPADATLARLARAGAQVWRTDREGTVSVDTDGRTFRVRGGRTDARFDARDSLPEMPTCCTRPR
jgi:competence protein ComEC